jgi:serine/threonine protein kinase
MYCGPADAPTWKLADFGIAKYTPRLRSRQTFLGWGTPGFMAPEQRNGAEAHPSADTYALGKVICWLLTDGTDPDAIIEPGWKALVDECVADDPDERPEIATVLERLKRMR